MEFIEYPDRELMMMDLANELAGELENVLFHEDFASLAVPGGTTPGPVFDFLCAADIEWDRVRVMLTDERWVPENSPRSNTRLVKERLLTNRAEAAGWVPLYGDAEAPEAMIDDLAQGVAACLPISVMFLGMGADMHTASLFPGADNLAAALDADAPPLMAMRAPGAPEPRITLTAPALQSALSCHILITGAEKREALEKARHAQTAEDAPVSVVLSGAKIHWAE